MTPHSPPAASPWRRVRSRFGIPAVALVALLVGTCSRMPGTLEQVRALGAVKVVTRNSPLAAYEGAAGLEGPEYELARGFAERLGVRLDISFVRSAAAALNAVARNRAHVAAAGLVEGRDPAGRVRFGPVFQRIDQHFIYRGEDPLPKSPGELVGRRIVVLKDSSHETSLGTLARHWPGRP